MWATERGLPGRGLTPKPQTHPHYTVPRESVRVAVMTDAHLSASLELLNLGKQ